MFEVPVAEQTLAQIVGRILNWDRWAKRALVMMVDVMVCILAAWLAFSIRLGIWMPLSTPLVAFTATALLLFPPIFLFLGTYRHIFRFSGAGTLLNLLTATAILSLPLIAAFSVMQVDGIPRTVAILHPILFFGAAATMRIVARYILVDLIGSNSRTLPVKRSLIYGAGYAGQQLQSALYTEPKFSVIGFFDDDKRLHRQRLNGIPVYHSEYLERVVKAQRVDTVFIAMPRLNRSERKKVIERFKGLDLHVQLLPSVGELMSGDISISDLREIRIEDLLGREPVQPNEVLLSRTIVDKTVLVTGAGGSIGSELCRQIVRSRPSRLVLADMSEPSLYYIDRELARSDDSDCEIIPELINMAESEQVDRLFARWRPDTVFHAAAYKHVPLVEANVVGGVRNNVLGTRNAAVAARKYETAHFVLISTDKAVRPTNVMGASKRVCELVLQALATEPGKTKFSMVRFGNVLGSSGSVVPHFERQIREGGPVTLTHRDVTRFFMTIPEAAQLVIQAGAMADGGEVFLLDMGAPIRIYDLACAMIKLSGRSVRDQDNPDGDIEIAEVGLRPGEKLYEELLIDSKSEPTRHSRIMTARECSLSLAELMIAMDELEMHLKNAQREGVLEVLQRLVPEYQRDPGLVALG